MAGRVRVGLIALMLWLPGAGGAQRIADRIASSGSPKLRGGEIMVYTAHQGWLSRIYLMNLDGSVIKYYEYEFYFLADLEVIDNEVYVAEAFAPRVLKVDLETGDLDVVVDDWSLYYFYNVAWEGSYFYVTEWDLNRYEFDGSKAGTASFDEDVNGGAWDGTYYWTLTDGGQIKCWDVSGWPTLTEIPENAFEPPTAACRGLWFDGECFWTAENIDGLLGQIYRFDYDGSVVDVWLEPAFRGWAACVVSRGVPGDLNCDGSINGLDIDPFVLALTSTPPDYLEYYAEYPDCDVTLGDCNEDGSINGLDIDPFVELLVGG